MRIDKGIASICQGLATSGLLVATSIFSGCSGDKPTTDTGIVQEGGGQFSVASRLPELRDRTPIEAIAAYEAVGMTGSVTVHHNGNCTAAQGQGKVYKQKPNVGSAVDSAANVALYAGCFNVEVTPTTNGKVTPVRRSPTSTVPHSVAGVFNVKAYDSITFMVSPDPGCGASEVLVNGEAVTLAAGQTYTLSDVKSEQRVSASFVCPPLVEPPPAAPQPESEPEPALEPEPEPANYSIVASVTSGNCSISPNGTVSVSEGNNQTFDISVGAGNLWADLSIDEVWVSGGTGGSTYTFANVSENHTISVTCYVFQEKPKQNQ